MICPQCGKEMDSGFLQTDKKTPITWVSKVLPMGIGAWAKDAKTISEPYSFGLHETPAYICKDCSIVIADYSMIG